MSSKHRSLLLIFALLGLVASSISTYVHHQLLTKPSYDSFCDVSTTVSCTEAYVSQYGSFLGVPVAVGGVIFFAIVLVLAGVTGRSNSPARDNAAGYIFALSTVGLAFALYLAWASYFVLNVFCILCAITYVSVIAIFIISAGATTFPMITLPRRASRDLRTLVSSPIALVLLLAITAGGAALIAAFPDGQAPSQAPAVATYNPLTADERAQLEAWWNVQPIVDLPVVPAAGTKVLIVKFSDYMCPSCRNAHNAFKPVLAKYQGQPVEFVLKHYPLEPECNVNTPGMNHYGSCEAAAAYEMAKGNPNQARLDDWLFDNQQRLTKDVVREAAEAQAGIKDYDARYDEAMKAVRGDVGVGALLNVNSTPTIFINGRRIPGGGLPPAYYDAIVEMELAKSK